LEIEGERDLIDVIDFSHIQSLYFSCETLNTGLSLTFIPVQLIELHLKDIPLTSDVLPSQAYYLPQLQSLKLESVRIEGALGMYIKLPKLKHLDLDRVWYLPLKNKTEDGHDVAGTSLVDAPHLVSLEGFPDLEIFSFEGSRLARGIVEKIRRYSKLTHFSMGGIDHEEFFSSFLEALADNRSFPSLKRFDFHRGSWKEQWSLSANDFIELCGLKRPFMDIYT
jgi:hypothetical protein